MQNQNLYDKLERDVIEQDIKVLDDGKVLMEETVKSKMWFTKRNFITVQANCNRNKEELDTALSEETKQNQIKNRDILAKTLDLMKPIRQKLDDEDNVKVIGNLLNQPQELTDMQKDRLLKFWDLLSDDAKKSFNPEQKNKVLEYIRQQKQQERTPQ